MNESKNSNPSISQMLLRLFENWNLSCAQKHIALGLTETTDNGINKSLKRSLAKDRDKLDRVEILLHIHRALRILFPQNREIAYRWILQPNKHFDGLTPLDVIERNGMLGMYMVRDYLDGYGAAQRMTIESLTDGSPDLSLNSNDREWLAMAPAGKEFPAQVGNFENEDVIAMLDIWTAALRIFGNDEKAKDWIRTAIPALGDTPVALLQSEQGREKVFNALKRIESADFG